MRGGETRSAYFQPEPPTRDTRVFARVHRPRPDQRPRRPTGLRAAREARRRVAHPPARADADARRGAHPVVGRLSLGVVVGVVVSPRRR